MNLTSIWSDSIVNFTKPFPEPLVHLRFLLCLIKSLSISSVLLLNISTEFGDVIEGVAYKAYTLANDRVGIQSSGVLIGNAETLNFVGTGNTFAVNGSTIDVSISSGAASIMTIGVRVGTAVTFTIPSTNTLDVVGRSGTVNVPV